jgi:hypothetical protein
MSYNITIPVNKDYVLVRVNRDITKALAMEYTKFATEVCKKNNLSKLLVDVRGQSSLSGVMGKYEFAYKDGEEVGLTRDMKVVVLRDAEKTDMQFLETVMRNAGFNYLVIANEEEAIDWLDL